MPGTRWLTFDCYGTIADWNACMLGALQPVAGVHAQPLLAAYHQAESILEAGPAWRPYREVLTDGLGLAARRAGVSLAEKQTGAFVDAWPSMPVFPDVAEALQTLASLGWRLAILTNCDDDLFAETSAKLPVSFEVVVTAEQVRSYKPDLGHFQEICRNDRGDARELDSRRQQLGARHRCRPPGWGCARSGSTATTPGTRPSSRSAGSPRCADCLRR